MEDKKGFKYWIEVSGIIFAVILITIWFVFFNFNNGTPWDVRGQLGDSFGSLNALFSGLALAGIIFTILLQRRELSMQREELKLQRNEMIATRKEFATNRLTNIIYNQIDIQEKAISDFEISNDANEFFVTRSGHSAFVLLDKDREYFTIPFNDIRTEEQILTDKIKHYQKNLRRYVLFEDSLLEFAVKTSNSVKVIKGVLGNSSLDGEEMKALVSLFFNNLGYTIIEVIKDIVLTWEEYLKLPERSDNPPIDFGRMGRIVIFLNTVLKVYKIDYLNEERDYIIKKLTE